MEFTARIDRIVESVQRLRADGACWDHVAQAVRWIVAAMREGHKLLVCGNGGSAADAQHVAGEMICRFYHDRRPLPAIALTTDTSVLTAVGNDYRFADVFRRQVEALGRAGDVLLGISTSGNSENVREAFGAARSIGIRTILLTGTKTGTIQSLADLTIAVPADDTPRIQELHLMVEHLLCEAIEKEFLHAAPGRLS